MGSKGLKIGLAELKMSKDDGSLFSRLEMEQKLREETVYHRRLRAFKAGLPNKIAQHMLPISVTHWLLDHWVQNKMISGEVLGVRAEFDADSNKEYVQQLAQRLMLFVEHGLAVPPNPGEGIDMSFVPPGFPPMPPAPNGQPNGQQAAPSFVPPPPPPMPGMPMPGGMPPQMAQQPMQMPMPPMPNQAPQGFPQQPGFPQGMQPPMPPMPPQPPQPPQPQGFPPQMQQPQFPTQQGFPQQQPQQPQTQQPPAGQMTPPTKADPTRVWGQAGKREDGTQRNRRTKEELAEDAAYEQWRNAGGDPNVGMGAAPQQQQAPQQPQSQPQPQQSAPPMLAPPNPFGNMPPQQTQMPFPGGASGGLPPMPQMGMPQAPAQQQAPASAPQQQGPALATAEQVEQLQNDIVMLKTGLAQLIRIMYQKEGPPDLYQVLTEVCKVRPQ